MSENSETDRPFMNAKIKHLERIVEELRCELAGRDSSRARTLREEIDPDFTKDRATDCQVYVVELREAVRGERRFRAKNPYMLEERPCLYVGQSSYPPEIRLKQHKAGEKKASRWVRDYGDCLRREFYGILPDMTRESAENYEEALALLLRQEGYGVWYG